MEQNDNSGGGSGTDFRSMPHQQMIDWLDQASSFYVRDASDRLKRAAKKMREIADELKKRPGGVHWEGEAEKAFMEWTTSLASTTHSLADYSIHSSNWLTEAADAIATAQSAIPRYTSVAQAKENLEAAQKYHNDPDSQTIARNARAQMAPEGADANAIKAQEETNRQAAAAEMERLSGTYQWSSLQMKSFQMPSFQPPPGEFVPQGTDQRDSTTYIGSTTRSENRATDTDTSTTTTRTQRDTRSLPDTQVVPPSRDITGPTQVIRPELPVDLGIDSVNTLPPPTTGTPPTTGGQPPLPRPDTSLTPPFTVPPGPIPGPPPLAKPGPGTLPPLNGTRMPVGPGGRTGWGPTGQLPAMPREGISGGRQVPGNPVGRSTTGIPRSTVIGQEPTGRTGNGLGRGPVGGAGMGHPAGGTGGGHSGITGGRRLASEPGGVVGGRAQRPGASGRPFTPGGSGLVRDGAQGSGPVGRGSSVPAAERREEERSERPDYLVEDEETWQQGGRRVAPPVID
ncbi:WXG100 family type VII secretion target [Streptomyces sp. NPDC053431]|uniref:WXG100 family type VII secretion target n=1 Tax=Streptomyces sp. NPDC053431 TaxID=3365703 RepID=UPI0037CD58AA